jgi:hypothetical protein
VDRGELPGTGDLHRGVQLHLSGGIALAEALGRFGQHGITSAFYWTYPPGDSPAAWAFRAFRNYDGAGARFLDLSVPTQAPGELSLFASRSSDGKKLVALLLNKDPQQAVNAALSLKGCGAAQLRRVFTYDGDPKGFVERAPPKSGLRIEGVPPYSMTVIELTAP